MRIRSKLALAGLAAVVLAAAVPVGAAEVSRESYRKEVEPLCEVNVRANERIFAGVRAMVKQGKLKQAARRFDRAAAALKETVRALRTVPRPPADVERLDKWFTEVDKEVALFKSIASRLRAGDKYRAQRMVVRLTSQAERANRVVVPFEFDYCRLDPSRFT